MNFKQIQRKSYNLRTCSKTFWLNRQNHQPRLKVGLTQQIKIFRRKMLSLFPSLSGSTTPPPSLLYSHWTYTSRGRLGQEIESTVQRKFSVTNAWYGGGGWGWGKKDTVELVVYFTSASRMCGAEGREVTTPFLSR